MNGAPIWDPETHHILQLMHIETPGDLPVGEFFDVVRGQPIGKLAAIDIRAARHAHVNVIDAETFTLIDPVTVLPSYRDHVEPEIGEVYVLDSRARKRDTLPTGAIDVVVTAHDRDDNSPRNLEIASLAFVAKDQDGREVARLARCELANAYERLAHDWEVTATTIRLLDFGNAREQVGGFWPDSDLGNPKRVFRYAMTNLALDGAGCSVVTEDRDGQIQVTPQVTRLTVSIEAWDHHGNRAVRTVTLSR